MKMRRSARVHQVSIDEYLRSQEDLFPDGVPVPAPVPVHPWLAARRVSTAPLFPGAIDTVDHSAPPDLELRSASRFVKRKISG